MIISWRRPSTTTASGRNGIADRMRYGFTPLSTVGGALAAGTASFVSSGPFTLTLTATNASGGTPAYTYQWQRSVDGGAYSNISNGGGVSGATTLTISDGSTAFPHYYGYQLVYTDSAGSPASITSNAVTNLYNYNGGALGGGGLARIIGG